jgi:hypothetical protein
MAVRFKAHGVEYTSWTQANLRIQELEKLNEEIGASDGRVTEILLIQQAMEAEKQRLQDEAYVREYPFYVYTRFYKANGDCIKGFKRFKTRAAQCRYVATTNKAVTAYN